MGILVTGTFTHQNGISTDQFYLTIEGSLRSQKTSNNNYNILVVEKLYVNQNHSVPFLKQSNIYTLTYEDTLNLYNVVYDKIKANYTDLSSPEFPLTVEDV